MRILIIRHADPDYEKDSLTKVGEREAILLSERLRKTYPFIKDFYVSPLGRAKKTASYTLSLFNKEAKVLPFLKEFPPLIKKPNKEAPSICWDWLPKDWVKYPEFFSIDTWLDNPVWTEEVKKSYKDVCDGLDNLLASYHYIREGKMYHCEKSSDTTIALFCHFGIESVLLSHLLNISPMLLWHGSVALPSSVTELISEERRKGEVYFRMNQFGSISHLENAGVEPSFSARFCEQYQDKTRHD